MMKMILEQISRVSPGSQTYVAIHFMMSFEGRKSRTPKNLKKSYKIKHKYDDI